MGRCARAWIIGMAMGVGLGVPAFVTQPVTAQDTTEAPSAFDELGSIERLVAEVNASQVADRVLFAAAGPDAIAELRERAVGIERSARLAEPALRAIARQENTPEADRALAALEVQLPLRRARAAVWLAACLTDPQDRGAQVRRALSIVEGVGPISTWASAERANIEAIATALAGDTDTARTLLADARLASTGLDHPSERDRLRREITLARLALAQDAESARAIARSASRSPVFDASTHAGWWHALMLTEVHAAAIRSPVPLAGHMLADPPSGIGERAAMLERLADVVDFVERADGGDQPSVGEDHAALLALARGQRVSRDAHDPETGASPGLYDKALRLAAPIVERTPDHFGGFLADMWFGRGSTLARRDDHEARATIEILIGAAERFPNDSRVPAALDSAVFIAPGIGNEYGIGAIERAISLRPHHSGITSWHQSLVAAYLTQADAAEGFEGRAASVLGAADAAMAISINDLRVVRSLKTVLEELCVMACEHAAMRWPHKRHRDLVDESLVEAMHRVNMSLLERGRGFDIPHVRLGVFGLEPVNAGRAPDGSRSDVLPGWRGSIEAFGRLCQDGETHGAASLIEAIRVIDARCADEGWCRLEAALSGLQARLVASAPSPDTLFLREHEWPASRFAHTIDALIDRAERRGESVQVLRGLRATAAITRSGGSSGSDSILRSDAPRFAREERLETLTPTMRAELVFAGACVHERAHPHVDRPRACDDDMLARAFAEFRTIALDAEPGTALWWYAWTRMLEIRSERVSADQHDADLAREIARLRARADYDPASPAGTRIEPLGTRFPIEPEPR
ncbi:MAG: hypothetical protein AAGI30_02455 [Planctomycetota bacterium]